jgi:hypothetical protein
MKSETNDGLERSERGKTIRGEKSQSGRGRRRSRGGKGRGVGIRGGERRVDGYGLEELVKALEELVDELVEDRKSQQRPVGCVQDGEEEWGR